MQPAKLSRSQPSFYVVALTPQQRFFTALNSTTTATTHAAYGVKEKTQKTTTNLFKYYEGGCIGAMGGFDLFSSPRKACLIVVFSVVIIFVFSLSFSGLHSRLNLFFVLRLHIYLSSWSKVGRRKQEREQRRERRDIHVWVLKILHSNYNTTINNSSELNF